VRKRVSLTQRLLKSITVGSTFPCVVVLTEISCIIIKKIRKSSIMQSTVHTFPLFLIDRHLISLSRRRRFGYYYHPFSSRCFLLSRIV
jgi:hypothetical protein